MSTSPLSILAVSLRYPPYVAGGYELFTRDAVEALRERGHRVSVLTGKGEELADVPDVLPWLEPALDEGDLFERSFRGSNLERFRLHFLRLANYRATRRALAATGADVLLFFNLGLVSLAPVLAARHRGVPTLGYVSDPWPLNHWVLSWREDERASGQKPLRLALLERLWRGFRDLVGLGPLLACSAYIRGRLSADGIPGEEIGVLHLGIPPDVETRAAGRAPTRRESGRPLRVACISSLWRGKGQDVLLAAARRAREEGAAIEVVLANPGGDPDFRRTLEEAAQSPGLAGAVRFAGGLDREALGELLAESHVLAVPSVWGEPFALATLEGMAHGLAVVTSDAGGSPEAVLDGASGLVVPAGDEASLAQALVRLERDEELRGRLASAAIERVRGTFSHDAYVSGLEEALRRLAGPEAA